MMQIDDLICSFGEMEKRDPWARLDWNSVENDHIIRLAGFSSVTSGEFRALLNDAGAYIAETPDNPGTTPTERFIVAIFTLCPELIAPELGPTRFLPWAYVGNVGEELRRVPASSATINNAARAALLTLRRMRGQVLEPKAAELQQREDATPFAAETCDGPSNPTPARAPEVPSRAVSLTHAAKKWLFNMDPRTLADGIIKGMFAAQQISANKWQLDLEEIERINPDALEDADPVKYKIKQEQARSDKNKQDRA